MWGESSFPLQDLFVLWEGDLSARILRAKREKKRQPRGDFRRLIAFSISSFPASVLIISIVPIWASGAVLTGQWPSINPIVSNQILLSLMASLPGRDTLGRIAYSGTGLRFCFACFRSVKGRAVVFFARARPIGVQARCAFRQTAATHKKSPPASMPP